LKEKASRYNLNPPRRNLNLLQAVYGIAKNYFHNYFIIPSVPFFIERRPQPYGVLNANPRHIPHTRIDAVLFGSPG
jgi:hypothetical protein